MKIADIAPPAGDELIVVVGPTASGKTELAVSLAERFGGEVVSADSVQIYRLFDAGSGKPSADERSRVRHHLVDAIDPLDAMDASLFAGLADAAIADIRARGRIPIVCGGAFLWVKALVRGLAKGAPRNDAIREAHRELAEKEGRAALHARLAVVDPESARRLAHNDLIRVSRALEVFELTGTTQTAWHEQHGFRDARYAARLLGVRRMRDELDRRIAIRVRSFLDAGWIEEVKGLLASGFGSARAMESVGYREVRAHIEGKLSESELEASIVRATRVFVRRQRTWLRDEPVTWIEP